MKHFATATPAHIGSATVPRAAHRVGDPVFFLRDGKVTESYVTGVACVFKKDSFDRYAYLTGAYETVPLAYYWCNEEDLFLSRQALLESL